MPLLFVYGSLIDPSIQIEAIGRVASLSQDKLNNYRTEVIAFEDADYLIALPSIGSTINGWLMEVSATELSHLDDYETDSYERIEVILDSGKQASIYVKPN